MEPSSRGKPTRSLIEILYEAPALLEALPPAALKSLSSTCKTLRTSFCAQVRTITLSCPGDASKVFCTTWPNLLMVVCPHDCKLTSKLPAQWEYMLNITVATDSSRVTAVLIRSQQQPHMPSSDLPRQHCAVLSDLCENYRSSARIIRLWGPFVGCRVLQSLTYNSKSQPESITSMASPQLGHQSMSQSSDCWGSVMIISISDSFLDASALLQIGMRLPRLRYLDLSKNQLDAHAVCALTQVKWPDLIRVSFNVSNLGSSGIQQLLSCSWHSLTWLVLEDACMDAPALQWLAQGQWPKLMHLDLEKNPIDAIGISYLLKGGWPRLNTLSLSAQGLDDKAYSLLGMTRQRKCSVIDSCVSCVEDPTNITSYDGYRPHLPQFPDLYIHFQYD